MTGGGKSGMTGGGHIGDVGRGHLSLALSSLKKPDTVIPD